MLVGSWGEVRQSSLNLNYGITLSRGGWVRFPRLWSRFWPFFTCVCLLLLGWKGCPFKSMKQELFDIVFASSVVFTISAYCNLCEGVCSCLLLMGWNGCRLVCLFAVAGGRAVPSGGVRQKLNRFWLSVIRSYHARVGGLAQALFRRLGFSAPPLPSLLSLLLLGICLSICWWGGSVCFSANLGPSNFSKSRSSPLHVVFSILFHYFLCSLPLPLFLQGWQGCLLTSGVVSVYLFGKVVPKGAWSKSSLTLCSLLCCLSLSLSLSPIDCIWVEGLALEGRSGKALSS